MVLCHSCKKVCEDYKELALHIQTSKKGHRKGKKWAVNYLLRVRQLDKRKLNGHIALTEKQKENRKNAVRILSGENEYVVTYCPYCRSQKRELMPLEFTQSRDAWRVKDKLVLLCSSCSSIVVKLEI